jgi:hypothetical protein
VIYGKRNRTLLSRAANRIDPDHALHSRIQGARPGREEKLDGKLKVKSTPGDIFSLALHGTTPARSFIWQWTELSENFVSATYSEREICVDTPSVRRFGVGRRQAQIGKLMKNSNLRNIWRSLKAQPICLRSREPCKKWRLWLRLGSNATSEIKPGIFKHKTAGAPHPKTVRK